MDDQSVSSVRQRKLTEKGHAYMIKSCIEGYNKAKCAWKAIHDNVAVPIRDISDASVLKELQESLVVKYSEFLISFKKFEALEFDEKSDICEEFNVYIDQQAEMEVNIKDRLSQLQDDDNVSVKSRHSHVSGKFSINSKGSNSSLDKKIELARRVAKCKTELMFYERELEYKKSSLLRESEHRKMMLLKDIELAKAEQEAIDQIVGNVESENDFKTNWSLGLAEMKVGDKVNQYLETQPNLAHVISAKMTEYSPQVDSQLHTKNITSLKDESQVVEDTEQSYSLNPKAVTFTPAPNTINNTNINVHPSVDQGQQNSTTVDILEGLSDMLAQKQKIDSLPNYEPDVFDGDLLKYPEWIISFQSVVERKIKDPRERLHYLKKYTEGEAKDSISNLLYSNSKEAYQKAKQILKVRYGNPFYISEAYRDKIHQWPKISADDRLGLRKFADFLDNCRSAMESIEYLKTLDDPKENQMMLDKLPTHIVNKWQYIIDEFLHNAKGTHSNIHGEDSFYISMGKHPTFSDFCKFLVREARVACQAVKPIQLNRCNCQGYGSTKVLRKGQRKETCRIRSFATESKEDAAERVTSAINRSENVNYRARGSCALCKEAHDIIRCVKFSGMSIKERQNIVTKNKLCRGCLKWGHMKKDCRNKMTCSSCQGKHPTLLHDKSFERFQRNQERPEKRETVVVSNNVKMDMERIDYSASNTHSLIVPVWLYQKNNDTMRVLVYALLDEQSDACFIKESTAKRLNAEGPEVQLKIATVLGERQVNANKIKGLMVCGVNETQRLELPPVYTKEEIPARRGQIPKQETAQKWPHLKEIADKLMPYNKQVEVGLLIGLSCTKALQPRELIVGKDGDPYAKRTILGWGIIGKIENAVCTDDDNEPLAVHRIVTQESLVNQDQVSCLFTLQGKVKEIIDPVQVNKMFELDFSERNNEEYALSYEDKRFLSKVEGGIHQLPSGQYEAPLPLKDGIGKLPNNKELALKRLMNLKRKINNNSGFGKDYLEFMSNMIDKGYAEEIVPVQAKANEVWYIPHHGVYHPRKPGKIRVVFDCSAVFRNQSLNQHLYQGPDLTSNLVGVLCRFRKESVAFMCDIEAMFHQVKVSSEHRDLLRFLWWKDGNTSSEVVEYRMTVHPFGATSSPSVANLVLKTVANEYEDMYGKETADFIRNDFYVDDGLKSVATAHKAIDIIEKSRELCKKGGFNLHKFVSNSKEVLSRIEPEQLASSVKNLDKVKVNIPVERTLGVEWCIESDSFQFRIHLKDCPLTRRGILSTVSSVFDPLGMVSPFILIGKRILQDLCCNGADWDDEIPDGIKTRWEKWRSELPLLQNLKIPRCYKQCNFDIKTAELHTFSDASQTGYGQCSYLRLIDTQDEIHCCLVMAKSRVTPLKPITIPRLELTAGVVAVKVSAMISKELDYQEMKEVFWTDSKVVLGYINNERRRFHTFVANRVQQIKDHTSAEQWKYIDSDTNPADHASRGLHVQNLISNKLWWDGPDFLWKPIENHTLQFDSEEILESDPEVKVNSVCATQTDEFASILERLEYFSDWHKAKRAVAVCLKLQKRYKIKDQSVDNCKYSSVNVQDITDAETEIIRQVQGRSFKNEIKILQELQTKREDIDRNNIKARKKTLKKASSLYKLDPFIDSNGILRIGGRIRSANFSQTEKHAAILPSIGHITELVVCDCHQKVKHQGRGITMNEIRSSGYWILGGSSVVAKHISSCVICKRLRKPLLEQKMSDLPVDRLEPAPPFTYCAVDYFGPWYVREGRRELKRYGVLFTCLVSRAVHLEIAHSLDTDSFLNAYRRFVCRRGPIRHLRSDQGTNFVGAKNELDICIKKLDHDKLRAELLKDNCDWIDFKMNVPQASHMGGVWERQIRTVRNIMTSLLHQHGTQLNDESLNTFMTEAEAIINSRPLTVNTQSNPECLEPITPNHLLTMKTKVVLPPPGIFQKVDMYCRKRWKRVQYLANEFWNRWKREYVQSLQIRNKWVKPKRSLKIDDIVIVKDESIPRNNWKMAKVVEAYKGEDGHVRKVKLVMADSHLDDKGRRSRPPTYLERPIHSLVYIM